VRVLDLARWMQSADPLAGVVVHNLTTIGA
jgi:hypothetical protein